MKHAVCVIFACVLPLLFLGCIREESPEDTPVNNFETLWRVIDTQYCFHDYKVEEGCLPWGEVYAKYRSRVHDGMSSSQLFEVLCDMLSELRDGHVNLYSASDVGRYWSWHEDYPANFSDSIHRRYLTALPQASIIRYWTTTSVIFIMAVSALPSATATWTR